MAEYFIQSGSELSARAERLYLMARVRIAGEMGRAILSSASDIDIKDADGESVRLHMRADNESGKLHVDEQRSRRISNGDIQYVGVRGCEFDLDTGRLVRSVSNTHYLLDLTARDEEVHSMAGHEAVETDSLGRQLELVWADDGPAGVTEVPALDDKLFQDIGAEMIIDRLTELINRSDEGF